MGLVITAEPENEPVTLEEMKAHLRVMTAQDDPYITGLIVAARMMIEGDTRRALITQSWLLTIDDYWPEHHDAPSRRGSGAGFGGERGVDLSFSSRRWRYRIVLPLPPLIALTSITYIDTGGVTQTLPPSQYHLAKSDTGEWYVEPAYDIVWPQVQAQMAAIAVQFDCGYGSETTDIPEPIRVAIFLLVGQWYDQRSTISLVTRSAPTGELPNCAEALVRRYRLMY